MATLALSALGTALGGPVGGLVGGLLGSFLDQQIMALFQDPIKGPRIDELRIPSFDEGSSCPWVLGPECRVPGQVIWVSKMREVKNESGGKGGGGGGAKTVTYDYFIDVAVGFARQKTASSMPVRKMWANGLLVYEYDTSWDKTSSTISATPYTEKKNFGYAASCTNKADKEYIDYYHNGSGVSKFFDGLKTGQMVTITGFANANNNGTFEIVSITNKSSPAGAQTLRVLRCAHAWKKSSSSYFASCSDSNASCAAGVTEAAGASVRFVQDVGSAKFNKSLIQDVTQYNGSPTQLPDPIIVAAEGTGNVPAFRGTTYVLIKNLKVNQWGGTIPGFEALIQESTTRKVSEAIQALCVRSKKLTTDDIDVTGVSGEIRGLAVMGAKEPLESLKALMLVYDIEAQIRGVIEDGVFKHKIFFFDKENAEEIVIGDDDRGASASGDEDVDLMKVTQTDPQDIPSEVMIQFVDSTKEWQPGTWGYRKAQSTIENQSRISLPVTMTPSNAIAVAKKVVWSMAINERLKVEISLPPTYVHVAEGDLLQLNDVDGNPIRVRVTQVDRGANGLIVVEALQEVSTIYTEPITGEDLPG